MKKEVSAGFVVFYRKDNNIYFLLLHYPSGHWDFPKGHVEEGETLIDAAKRELKEETGIEDIVVYPGFSEKISYYYFYKDEKRFKEVYFFLAESKTFDVVLSHEHIGFRWLLCGEALNLITYDNARKVLKKACAYLEKYVIKRQLLPKQ